MYLKRKRRGKERTGKRNRMTGERERKEKERKRKRYGKTGERERGREGKEKGVGK